MRSTTIIRCGEIFISIWARTRRSCLIANYSEFDAAGVIFAPVFSGDPNDFVDLQSNFPNRGDGDSQNYTAKLESDLGFATFSSITGYTRLEQVR